ncbi:MAG: hypothetical protein ACI9CF_002050, partial [Candidatus Omnitrophota bacterium]
FMTFLPFCVIAGVLDDDVLYALFENGHYYNQMKS